MTRNILQPIYGIYEGSVTEVGTGIVQYDEDNNGNIKYILPSNMFQNLNQPGHLQADIKLDYKPTWKIQIPESLNDLDEAIRYFLFSKDTKALQILREEGCTQRILDNMNAKTDIKTIAEAEIEIDLGYHRLSGMALLRALPYHIVDKTSFIFNVTLRDICHIFQFIDMVDSEGQKSIYQIYLKPWYEYYSKTHKLSPVGVAHNCGNSKRSIYCLKDEGIVQLGCFRDTYDKAYETIDKKYDSIEDAANYKAKIHSAVYSMENEVQLHLDYEIFKLQSSNTDDAEAFKYNPNLPMYLLPLYIDCESAFQVLPFMDIDHILFMCRTRPEEFTPTWFLTNMKSEDLMIHLGAVVKYIREYGDTATNEYFISILKSIPTERVLSILQFNGNKYVRDFVNTNVFNNK